MDAHGHTNAMLSLAEELKLLNYCTIFITNTTETPKLYGHELILIEGQEVAKFPESICEEDAFLGAKLFDHDWDFATQVKFDVDLANDSEWDAASVDSTSTNFKLWSYFWNKSGETDAALEKLLIDIRPDLVVAESLPQRPAVVRLADKSYAHKVAGWSHGLRWMQLSSFGPLWLYYFADLASRQQSGGTCDEMPALAPLFGLPIRRRLGANDYLTQSERFKGMLISGGILKSANELHKLATMENLDADSLSDSQVGQLLHSESGWLNVFMYPQELDYEQDFENKLDKALWMRVDSLVRPTSSSSRPLDSDSERLLADLASWKESNKDDATAKVVYVSLGTVVSDNFDVMQWIMQQVFTCLKTRKQWRFAVSLGKRRAQICAKFHDELAHWQDTEQRLIAKGWWPQPDVFHRHLVDGCVIHGGNNTICELFHFSPPPAIVVVPGASDQLDNARRLEELDLGVALPLGRFIRNNKDTMLMDALDRAFELHQKGPEPKSDRPRRDARYCAQVVSAKLKGEFEC